MHRLRDIPIKYKLMLVMMITCTVALVLACTAFILTTVVQERQRLAELPTTLAEVIGHNSTAALSFADPDRATELLQALSYEPHIVAAAIYDRQGQLFAHYTRGQDARPLPATTPAEGANLTGDSLVLLRGIYLNERRVGTVLLESDLTALRHQIKMYLGIALVVLGASIGVALLLAAALQRVVSRPILALSQTAHQVSAGGDYRLRAAKLTNDELGLLTDAFNEMLGQIEVREAALRQARDELEARVNDRTAALRESEARMRGLLESAPDGIVIIDQAGRITLTNRQIETLFGYRPEELIGQSVELLVPERLRDVHVGHRGDFVREPHARAMGATLDLSGRRKDGSEFPVEISLSPLPSAGGHFVTSIIRDVTERKRAQEVLARQTADLARSNTELEQFAYVASHDLQEPLRTISGFVELLARRYQGKLDAEADTFIKFTVEGTWRMHALINDLLSYSQVGRRPLHWESTHCDRVLDTALANLAVAIQETSTVIAREPLPVVQGDPTQLTQLLQNLIGNAIKFHGAAPPRVAVSARARGRDWLFAVRDNGIGIAPAQAPRIFQIFQRLHRHDEYPGTGIGLAICKKIVERHGGDIWVESQEGEGATFCFTLPRRPHESPAALAHDQPPQGISPP